MSSTYGGLIANLMGGLPGVGSPPVPVSISSSTDHTPITVTTAAPHLLHTGDEVLIRNHLTNTNANGFWVAGTVTGTTVVLLGSTATGGGNGGATGTVQSLQFDSTATIPADGDTRSAASVDVPLESLLDRTSFLWAFMGWYHTIFAGGTLAINVGGRVLRAGGLELNGTGATTKWRPAIAGSNSNSSYDVGHDRYSIPVLTADRVYTLTHTTGIIPTAGMRIKFNRNLLADGLTHKLDFQREDATVIATFPTTKYCWVEFEFDGSAWSAIQWSDTTLNIAV